MGIADRKEREKELRRNLIVDAAEQLFFSKGINATTMDEIAAVTELSKGTLYLYFKSKEELYMAIVARGMRFLHGMIEEAAATDTCGLRRLFLMGQQLHVFSLKHPNYFEAVFFHSMTIGMFHFDTNPMAEDLNQMSNSMFQRAYEVLQVGIADGSIRADIDLQLTAFSLQSLIIGLIRMVNLEQEHMMKCHGVSPDQLINNSFDLIKHALQSPEHQAVCDARCIKKEAGTVGQCLDSGKNKKVKKVK